MDCPKITKEELLGSNDWACLSFLGFPNNWVSRWGDVITTNRRGSGQIAYLTPVSDKDGYLTYNLNYGGVKRNCKGHRLVALCFIPNPDNLPEVDHLDGEHDNNVWTNLMWCTGKRNVHNYMRQLQEDKYLERCKRIQDIIRDYQEGHTQAELCRKYGVSATYVHRIVIKHNVSLQEETYYGK